MNGNHPELIIDSIMLEDQSSYIFSIRSVEITNFLGSVIGILQEYSFSGVNGENYKLYKTKEGNWYETDDKSSPSNSNVLRALKLAIDRK
jgi:hypothetical protein